MNELVKEISEEKFKAYAGLTIHPIAEYFSQQIAWFSNNRENILGVLLFDLIDHDFNCVLMGRDEIGQFRAFDVATDFNNPNAAVFWIYSSIEKLTIEDKILFTQGDKTNGDFVDFFQDVVPIEKQHPYYQLLKNSPFWSPAKKLIQEIMSHYRDIDGNFIEQFQSTGFDQRLWELYLFNYFKEEKLEVIREYDYPDFILKYGDDEIGVEAVTISRKTDLSKNINIMTSESYKIPQTPDEKILKNDMPLMWGSSLYSKLMHTIREEPKSKTNLNTIHYWETPQLKNKPFIIAIQDFHDDYCMTWSQNSLIEFLYGYRYKSMYINDELVIIPEKISSFNKKGKEIPAGFFFQPLVENISAIIATPLGTLSKFNRLGKQAGFDSNDLHMLRIGTMHNHEKNANTPLFFKYFVTEESRETWAEGVSVFHNPNALHPLNKSFFPNAAHHFFKDQQIVSEMPKIMPYNSWTLNLHFRY